MGSKKSGSAKKVQDCDLITYPPIVLIFLCTSCKVVLNVKEKVFTDYLQELRSFRVVTNWICYNIVLSFLEVSPCELHCTPKGLFGLYFSKKLADQVHDGTPCAPGKRDVCINGKCEVCNKVNYLVVIFSFPACRLSLQAADLCLFFSKACWL